MPFAPRNAADGMVRTLGAIAIVIVTSAVIPERALPALGERHRDRVGDDRAGVRCSRRADRRHLAGTSWLIAAIVIAAGWPTVIADIALDRIGGHLVRRCFDAMATPDGASKPAAT